MKKLYLRNFIFILAIIAFSAACDNSSDSDNQENAAMIEGRVENTSSSDTSDTDSTQTRFKTIEGASVTAARVQSDGSLEVITDSAVTTDAEGEFTLRIDASAVSDEQERLVVIAENEGEMASAFVTSEVESGVTAIVQPITFESEAEAEVYQRLVANGNIESVEKADIEVFVNTEVAADIESDSALATEMAAGLAAYVASNNEFYNALNIEVSAEQQDEINQIKFDAQTELENRLYAAEGQATAAFEDFVETIAQAEMEAGINATDAAKASQGSSVVLLNETSELSEGAQAEIRQQTALMLTFPLSEGVQEQLEFAGASSAGISNAADAAANLRTSIQTMDNPTEEDINAAFEAYNQEIVNIIQDEFEINGGLFAVANANINGDGGAKTDLDAKLDGTTAIPAVVDAYTEFFDNAESVINNTFENATEAELRTYFTQLLILINLEA